MSNFNDKHLIGAISRAESLVVEVKDEALKRVAFEQILRYLLNLPLANTTTKVPRVDVSKEKSQSSKLSGPKAWLLELKSEGYFSEPRTMKVVLEELSTRNHILKASDLTRPFESLVLDKLLRRIPKTKEYNLRWVNW